MGCRTCFDLTYLCQRQKGGAFENWCLKQFMKGPKGAKSLFKAKRWYRGLFGDGKWWKVKNRGKLALVE